MMGAALEKKQNLLLMEETLHDCIGRRQVVIRTLMGMIQQATHVKWMNERLMNVCKYDGAERSNEISWSINQ